MKKLIFAFIMTAFASANALAQYTNPQLVRYDLSRSYIPLGFDGNDNVQIVIEGELPSTCFRTGPASATVSTEDMTITLKQQVYKYRGIACLFMVVPFHKVLNVGILRPGEYRVVNEAGFELGRLPVKASTTSAADDYLYAPVADAQVKTNTDGSSTLSISGHYTNNCPRIKELRVIEEGNNVVTILPIIETPDGYRCVPGNYPFSKDIQLPKMPKGKYLFNVRSLNGDAIFKFFDI